jgi:NAD(P)-dependent dehydrogenase (short-subunit alcohol dehydrogenase family)
MTAATPRPRTALVTGGAQRLGRAIALALAADGWDVAVHYFGSQLAALATVADIQALGCRGHSVHHDLDTPGDMAPLFDACEAALGPVHCVVNNASLFENDGAATFTVAGFEAHMRTNVAAPIRLALALHSRLPDEARGVVVNLLDQKLWNPNPDFLSYTLSKAALESATGLLALALAPRLRVVGVAPGITLPAKGQTPAGFAAAHRATPLGRGSTPEDIAAAVVYLANAPAVTGTTLLVDGGQHLVRTGRDIMFLTS